jgi:AraC-like DNA-binding protein
VKLQSPYPRHYLYNRIVQAKLFIDEHYAEAIDASDIADEAFFSKFHFIRLFRKIYAKTPHQYLTHVRIEKVKELLQRGVRVSDASLAVGFESAGSFSSLFKRAVGMSPSDYSEAQRLKKDMIREVPLAFIPGCFAEKKGWKAKKSNFQEGSC